MINVLKLTCKLMTIFMLPFFLSACVTKQLSADIRGHETGYTHYNDDVIIGMSLAQQGGNKSWAFVGTHFDYVLSSGVDEFATLLVTGQIDKKRIQVVRDGSFRLNDKKDRFIGNIELKYIYQTVVERDKIKSLIKNTDWNCSSNTETTGVCNISLDNLVGTIHRKGATPSDIFRFEHPLRVNFYSKNTSSAKRALYPVAVAADVVMLPVYLLGGAAVAAFYGVVLLN
ncbi:putative lipoprotein [Yersinia rochesterensis]|uniref:Lipoprotein n=1 Tax=Yersinia rochesterensis TaxID=1604335 RepID=A0ABN4FHS7_9GAMM|nr:MULTISPECIES: hypothetical protein [Yersinia]AJI87263.1 putative lipoprotein [Yersinia frederiksenii Y225]AIN17686.1 putative lipoprotein [Yersinia rochesterensis]AJJ36411.1 putative lipoprotein [Yersinia rochesterensis]MDR4898235.1 hypothetical protein [Yersinia kristensenii]MDX6734416.1 hypothetical protein [Yersinia kristensenii]